jgi:hypothetical protein
MWRCRPQAAMVMKMKRTSSLDISVAESEAKLDASACHSLVGGVAMSAVMKLNRAPISDANSKDPHETVLAIKHFNLNHTDIHTQSSNFLYKCFSSI